ncbi:N-acetyl sugar amidotransferase [Leptospira biflexa]|uniref:N-acetyl sugar amidotransferase n=1 Tax=Leptospira biflexa TaxID=172 RepID=UPI0010830722|nr:N-acetyl sugar amidotransferase [Leptospira biflexa]TGM31712.1 N-acetyl sugar amidotransferase [Leptospira biflexa]TGM39129.1 N-acetyl sugar amidotransferase [Leptospira biflexa]TGM44541.1 N-acetyl sugar amidotransferase [Leptospira biflexa]TGM45418.1 N-acetyl sugar amidotransferase [Leptospira biflexa]TGM53972.1 N-acetyl sugar amidotransferase [Leptospira biflexa]
MEKRNLIKLYNLPEVVKFCKKCTVSNQRPRISFDENGVCSACNFAEFKRTKIDWKQRENELVELCNRYRKNNGEYDVIVPCSGGKDGGFVAHQLKYKYGMNPLTVTWAPLKATDIGRKNLDAFIGSGFDNILGTPNGKVTRQLTHLSFKFLGDPFQPFIYGQTNFPMHMAIKYNVSLIMYGENGEVEYGGDMKNAFRPNRDIQDHDKHYFSGLPPEFWTEHGISANDLKPFMAPKYEDIVKNKTEIHFLGYYKFWDPQENFYYCQENTGFTPNSERSEGTYSKYASLDDRIDGFHYYLAYIKFGIGRTTSDTAHEIRDHKITREEGAALVKRYDGEFPKKHYNEFLEYCSITDEEFQSVIDSWRSDHIWKKNGGEWELIHKVWES